MASASPSLAETHSQPLRLQWELLLFLARSRRISWARSRLLGTLWWLIEPVLMTATYIILVRLAFRGGEPNYALFLMCAILPWRWFTSSVGAASQSIVLNAPVLKTLKTRYITFPNSEALAATDRFLYGLPVFAALWIWYGLAPTPSILWLPFIILCQLALNCAFGIWLALITAYANDTQQVWNVITRVWFFCSPSLYSLERVPERYLTLYMCNPFALLFTAYRDVVLYGRTPPLHGLLILLLVSLLGCYAGAWALRRQEGHITKIL